MERLKLKVEMVEDSGESAGPVVPVSGGPRTQAGKAVAKMNASKHGLNASQPVIPQLGEREEDWRKHLAETREHFMPASRYEEDLVEIIAHQTWHIKKRVLEYRRETITQACDDADNRALRHFMEPGPWGDPEAVLRRSCLAENAAMDKADRAMSRALGVIEKTTRLLRQSREDHHAWVEVIQFFIAIGLVSQNEPPEG